MGSKFQPIVIQELAVSETQQSPTASGLRLMYLKLSAAPSDEWVQLFENHRQFPRHSMWRKAWVEGRYLVVDCVPEEIEQYHLRDLKEDVTVVNEKYKEWLDKQAEHAIQVAEKEKAETTRLNNIKARLKFD